MRKRRQHAAQSRCMLSKEVVAKLDEIVFTGERFVIDIGIGLVQQALPLQKAFHRRKVRTETLFVSRIARLKPHELGILPRRHAALAKTGQPNHESVEVVLGEYAIKFSFPFAEIEHRNIAVPRNAPMRKERREIRRKMILRHRLEIPFRQITELRRILLDSMSLHNEGRREPERGLARHHIRQLETEHLHIQRDRELPPHSVPEYDINIDNSAIHSLARTLRRTHRDPERLVLPLSDGNSLSCIWQEFIRRSNRQPSKICGMPHVHISNALHINSGQGKAEPGIGAQLLSQPHPCRFYVLFGPHHKLNGLRLIRGGAHQKSTPFLRWRRACLHNLTPRNRRPQIRAIARRKKRTIAFIVIEGSPDLREQLSVRLLDKTRFTEHSKRLAVHHAFKVVVRNLKRTVRAADDSHIYRLARKHFLRKLLMDCRTRNDGPDIAPACPIGRHFHRNFALCIRPVARPDKHLCAKEPASVKPVAIYYLRTGIEPPQSAVEWTLEAIQRTRRASALLPERKRKKIFVSVQTLSTAQFKPFRLQIFRPELNKLHLFYLDDSIRLPLSEMKPCMDRLSARWNRKHAVPPAPHAITGLASSKRGKPRSGKAVRRIVGPRVIRETVDAVRFENSHPRKILADFGRLAVIFDLQRATERKRQCRRIKQNYVHEKVNSYTKPL